MMVKSGNNRVVAIIQQRMGSSRFPGKAREQLAGMTVAEHVFHRACCAVGQANVIMAVPAREDFSWFPYQSNIARADCDDTDLVTRFAHVLMSRFSIFNVPDIIIRITGDCPLLPVHLITRAWSAVRDGYDYVESRSDPSPLPNGIDVQAFTFNVFRRVHHMTTNPYDREHMTWALKHHADVPHTLRLRELDGVPPFRITVDTPEDLESLRRVLHVIDDDLICPHLGGPSLDRILMVQKRHPELFIYDQAGNA